jgi:hypothetical protein
MRVSIVGRCEARCGSPIERSLAPMTEQRRGAQRTASLTPLRPTGDLERVRKRRDGDAAAITFLITTPADWSRCLSSAMPILNVSLPREARTLPASTEDRT